MRKLTVGATALVFALLLAGPAFAATGEQIPHGGYSSATDSCLQCHEIHTATGDYVLMRENTVTDVCATCHPLYQRAATGAYDPESFEGALIGEEAPDLAAYKVPYAERFTHAGHPLGTGRDEIPGGSQVVTAIQYLGYPATVSALEFEATNGLYCASCHTPHGTFGHMMPLTFNTSLLSSRPNHGDDLSGLTSWQDSGSDWCGSCHDLNYPDPDAGLYNHPLEPHASCFACHAEPVVDTWGPLTDDWPHTSYINNMLFLPPDELCLQCHVKTDPPMLP